jgi:hypothetical protein
MNSHVIDRLISIRIPNLQLLAAAAYARARSEYMGGRFERAAFDQAVAAWAAREARRAVEGSNAALEA